MVRCTQRLWAVLFTLGLIWNPLGRQDLWIIMMEMNDYGIFCMECSMMVLADDPPLPPLCPYNLCAFCLYYWPPLMLCDSDVRWNLSELSAAECRPVTTVCMLADLKPSTQSTTFFLVTVHANKSIYLYYSPAYLQLSSTCLSLCQSLFFLFLTLILHLPI